MTNHTEARLAREAEIAYASLAMATDYDCWHEAHGDVTVDMVIKNLQANAKVAQQIVTSTAEKISQLRPPSDAHKALKNSLMTSKEMVPEQTRERVNLFTKAYWGDLKN
jgi:5'-methylthioadenosine phosphorylase